MSTLSLCEKINQFFDGLILKRIDETTIELVDKKNNISLGILYYGTSGVLNRYMKPKNINNFEMWFSGFIKLYGQLKNKEFNHPDSFGNRDVVSLLLLEKIFKRVLGEENNHRLGYFKSILDFVSNIEVISDDELTKVTVKYNTRQSTVNYRNGNDKHEVIVNLLKEHMVGISNPNLRKILNWRGNLEDLSYEEKELFKKVKLVEIVLTTSRYRELYYYYGLSFGLS